MAKRIRTAEFAVLPTKSSKTTKMSRIAGACRCVWIHFREKNLAGNQAFRNSNWQRPQISCFGLGKKFTALRHNTDWMRASLLIRSNI